jgi:hypothetical protein
MLCLALPNERFDMMLGDYIVTFVSLRIRNLLFADCEFGFMAGMQC